MVLIIWWEISFPTDCDGTLDFPALPDYSNECIPIPGKSQINEIYITPDGATDGFNYSGGDPTLTVGGFDNSVTDNSKSKFLPCSGGMDAPEPEIWEGPKEIDTVISRRYQLNLEIPYETIAEYLYLKHFQGNYRKYIVRFGDLDGWLFGGENGIRPFFVDAQFPKENSRTGRKICTLLIDFVTKDGDPPAHPNPMA